MPRQNRGKRLPTNEVRSQQVNAYVSPVLKKKLRDFAKSNKLSESDVVKDALEDYISRNA